MRAQKFSFSVAKLICTKANKMKGILILSVLLGAFASISAQKPWDPTPINNTNWMNRHNGFVQTSTNNASSIDIVFLGSSSIDNWDSTGKQIWDAKYLPLKSVNYGIGGDKIENCLWRIMNGELDNISPKLFILYCGSNNVGSPVPDEVAQGVIVTLEEIERRLPETKVLYVGFNPRGDLNPVNTTFEKIVAINDRVKDWAEGSNQTTVFDMFNDLIEEWGKIKEYLYEQDKLHLNYPGYVLWDSLWNSTFYGLLN